MPSKNSKYRLRAFKIQSGKCFYCGHPMWERDITSFAINHRITLHQAKRFQSTAEHLNALQDGGQTSSTNIVAACLFCNSRRHKRKLPLAPIEYKRLVEKRLTVKKWNLF